MFAPFYSTPDPAQHIVGGVSGALAPHRHCVPPAAARCAALRFGYLYSPLQPITSAPCDRLPFCRCTRCNRLPLRRGRSPRIEYGASSLRLFISQTPHGVFHLKLLIACDKMSIYKAFFKQLGGKLWGNKKPAAHANTTVCIT